MNTLTSHPKNKIKRRRKVDKTSGTAVSADEIKEKHLSLLSSLNVEEAKVLLEIGAVLQTFVVQLEEVDVHAPRPERRPIHACGGGARDVTPRARPIRHLCTGCGGGRKGGRESRGSLHGGAFF